MLGGKDDVRHPRKLLTCKPVRAFMTPHSAGFCVFADTYPDLAGFVALVIRTVSSLPRVLPPTFLLQPGFKLHKEMGANWRWVDCVARTELEPGCLVTVHSRGSVLLPSSGRCLFLGLLSNQHFQPHELSKAPTLQINYFPRYSFSVYPTYIPDNILSKIFHF